MAVAAVLYLDGTAASVEPGCADAVCAVDALVRQAAAAGAKLIVAPEYALPQPTAEAVPAVGEVPTTRLLEQFAATADAVDAFVVVQLLTEDGGERFNSQVALGPDGTVRAVHHKVELYGDERRTLAPGEGPTTFDTPFGRVGMLVCADLYADPALHVGLVQAGIDIVAVSERWTVPGAARWPAAFAHDWGVIVVAANSASGDAAGGGIFGPSGVIAHGTTTGAIVDHVPSGRAAGQ